MTHKIIPTQLISFGLIFAAFSGLFALADRLTMAWIWVSVAGSAIGLAGSLLFLPVNPLTLVLVGIIFLEYIIMVQFWGTHVYNRAGVALLLMWLMIYLFTARGELVVFRRWLLITGLIFLILFGIVVFTLPTAVQY